MNAMRYFGVLFILKGVILMKRLLKEYKNTRKEIRCLLESAKDTSLHCIDERQEGYINSLKEIISDLNYSIEWMETGRRPGLRRGIERRAAYQREKAMDPLIMQKYFHFEETEFKWDIEKKYDSITSWDRERIIDALSVLTDCEREVYLMSRAKCISYREIANLLKISKSSVQMTIKRAEIKIGKRIRESLFCICG